MFAAVDVHYRDDQAAAAAVTFDDWTDATPRSEHLAQITEVEEYVPGAFFKRELPAIQTVLALLDERPTVVLVDGHVWLDGGQKGLGAHLYDALGGEVAVIGIAKNGFRGLSGHSEVLRGGSARPLFVTSIGFDGDAAKVVESMHGPYRIPTLLRRVDQVCRRGLGRVDGR